MSSTIVLTRKIDKISIHPKADRLDLAIVGGWQCCVPKGKYKEGDLVTYIPPDSVLPTDLVEKLGIQNYLKENRIHSVRLMGEPSFGLVIDAVGEEGENVAKLLGITKYQAPLNLNEPDAELENPFFSPFTDIENLRNFPSIFNDGEEVVVMEKIHGKNSRLGYIREDNKWNILAGGKTLQRKKCKDSPYWYGWNDPSINELFFYLASSDYAMQIVVYGETFGKTQKKMPYGIAPGKMGFRPFNILVNGRYLDIDESIALFNRFNIEHAPVLYRGPYSLDKIKELSSGKSNVPGANHIREGVVVYPVKERTDPKIGRVVLKYVSDEFLCGKMDVVGE